MRLILAICLIASFSVGVGLLAIAAVAGLTSFNVGVVATFLVWLFGMSSALLYLEAFFAAPEANHVISLSKKLVGRGSLYLAVVSFLGFNYCLLTSYNVFLREISSYYPLPSPTWVVLGVNVVFGFILYLKREWALSTLALFFCLFLALFAFDFLIGGLYTKPSAQPHRQFYYIFLSIPIIFSASFFQTIIPSLLPLLKRNKVKLQLSIWIGYTLSMLILILWLWLSHRQGTHEKLLAAYEGDISLAKGMLYLQGSHQLKILFEFLVIFVILAAMLGAFISMIDFFKDACAHFKIKNQKIYMFWILIFSMLPAYLISLIPKIHILIFSSILTVALQYVLATVLPIKWVWSARYTHKLSHKPLLFGGKNMLIVMIFASLFLLLFIGTVPIHQLGRYY